MKHTWIRSVSLAAGIAAALIGNPARADAEMQDQFVNGPWGQIHVRVAGGTDQPTALLLHQIPWSAEQFRQAQQRLAADGVRSIAIDIPGNGLSQGPDAPVALAPYGEAVGSVVKGLGLSAANIVGVGEGGIIASAFAAAHPGMARHLVLDGVAPFTAIERERYHTLPRIYVNPRADGSHLPAAWKIARQVMGDGMTTAAVQSVVSSVYVAGEKAWFAKDAAYVYDIASAIKSVRAPTLLIDYAGQARPQAVAEARKLRPDFTVEKIESTHPTPSFDDPNVWADAVAAYIKR